ncbi:uncharacterized protein LOC135810051 [Sycon ciliatum]|uniref:uncharacterized protein LOC135810051 n=1 Tax=Sycon ciliatum TaxID=27933 RepID=UPI0031F71C76
MPRTRSTSRGASAAGTDADGPPALYPYPQRAVNSANSQDHRRARSRVIHAHGHISANADQVTSPAPSQPAPLTLSDLTGVIQPLLERVERLESNVVAPTTSPIAAPAPAPASAPLPLGQPSPMHLACAAGSPGLPVIPPRLRERITRGIQAPGPGSSSRARSASLANSPLTDSVLQLAALAIAPSSRRTYSTAETRYFQFCQVHACNPLPGDDFTLCYFAAELFRTLQPRSVRVYMSAIRNLHVELGFAYPSGPTTLLARVLRGIDRSSSTQRHRLPITTPLLREICRHVAVPRMRHPHDKAMLRAAFSLAFHGFFRCGELTAGLRRCDVTISTDQRSLSVNVRSSKTDPDSTGHTVLVGASTDALICPVQAMANYLAFRPGGDHLFTYANGQPLTRNAVSSELRNLLPLCGVTDPSAYASHSFRIGAATSAAMAGVPEHIIRIMGRWRSDAVHRYIRAATADTLRVSRQLAAVQSHQW